MQRMQSRAGCRSRVGPLGPSSRRMAGPPTEKCDVVVVLVAPVVGLANASCCWAVRQTTLRPAIALTCGVMSEKRLAIFAVSALGFVAAVLVGYWLVLGLAD
jgi:hypothetical protein